MLRRGTGRVMVLLAALVMLAATWPTALAAQSTAQAAAEALYEMGLLGGAGTLPDGTPDFNLTGRMSRGEAVTMVVRLTGGREDALAGHYPHPFTDVAPWGQDYVGYAYTAGIANGVGGASFGFGRTITQAEYLTMLLRAMGYGDVDWRNPYATAARLGLTAGVDYNLSATFSRGDMAVLSQSMLEVEVAGTGVTLYQALEALDALAWRALPQPSAVITPGPVYNNVSDRAAVGSGDDLLAKFAAMVDARHSRVVLTTPAGQEEAYSTFLLDNINRYPDVDTLHASWYSGTGELAVDITYRDGVRVMAWLEGKLDSLSAQDMALYQEAQRVHDSLVTADMSAYQRVKAFHDYLCDTVTYREYGAESHTAYGALVNHASVCQGYTQSMDLLCYLSGIDCEHIFGTGTSNGVTEDHSWVRVNIDGGWYNVDVTWDDQESYISYQYFLVSDAHMYGHSWYSYPNWPPCPSDYPR